MRFWIIVLLGASLYVSLASGMSPGQGRPSRGRHGLNEDVGVDETQHVLKKRSVVGMENGASRCCNRCGPINVRRVKNNKKPLPHCNKGRNA